MIYYLNGSAVLVDEGAERRELERLRRADGLLRRMYAEQDGDHAIGRGDEWLAVFSEVQEYLGNSKPADHSASRNERSREGV
ncbi:MAG: hypothetical protein WC455_14710 [Dehalococcoidia bacterium]|jgi:hypothetical protein